MAGLGRCEQLAHPNIPNFLVSCFIVLGLVVSYLPQIWRIVNRRSSEGISAYFVLLGTTSGTCAIANILTLPTSRADIACCEVNDVFSCTAGLLGVVQIGLQWSCFFLIMFLFLIFVKHSPTERLHVDDPDTPLSASPRLVEAIIVVAVSIIHFVITFLVSVIILARFPDYVQGWANVLGIGAAILASTQYLPQIWTTWKLQHVGSFSIPMMLMQTPGGYIFAGSLYARLGPEGWSAWSVYLVLATLQGILLVMALAFDYRDRRHGREAEALDERARASFADDDSNRASSGSSDSVRPHESTSSEYTPLLSDPERPKDDSSSEDRDSQRTIRASRGKCDML